MAYNHRDNANKHMPEMQTSSSSATHAYNIQAQIQNQWGGQGIAFSQCLEEDEIPGLGLPATCGPEENVSNLTEASMYFSAHSTLRFKRLSICI